MANYVELSLVDKDLVKEISPILYHFELEEHVREVFLEKRINDVTQSLMEILEVGYVDELNYHVLTPDLIDKIVEGLEERKGIWDEVTQNKCNKLTTALIEYKTNFAFEGEELLLLSWLD